MKKIVARSLAFASISIGILSAIDRAEAREPVRLDPGTDGAALGCLISGWVAPGHGACLENPWNRERWEQTLEAPGNYDNPFVPEQLNPSALDVPEAIN